MIGLVRLVRCEMVSDLLFFTASLAAFLSAAPPLSPTKDSLRFHQCSAIAIVVASRTDTLERSAVDLKSRTLGDTVWQSLYRFACTVQSQKKLSATGFRFKQQPYHQKASPTLAPLRLCLEQYSAVVTGKVI